MIYDEVSEKYGENLQIEESEQRFIVSLPIIRLREDCRVFVQKGK